MNLSAANPLLLALLPLAALPFLTSLFAAQAYPALGGAPRDALSAALSLGLKFAAAIAIAGIVLGLAGLHQREQLVERIGKGAHISLLVDRSSSMDNTFAGKQPSGAEEAKGAAAERLLHDFAGRRSQDQFGVAVFSTSPIQVLPMTGHRDAVLAAIGATGRPGLAYTNVGLGLAMALSLFDARSSGASRTVLFVSDGAALIEPKIRERLRAEFVKQRVNLYWLFLRTVGSPGLYPPEAAAADKSPQANPEYHLHKFFLSLGIPYRAFEAENARAVEEAIAEIEKFEVAPIRYEERVPQQNLAPWAYGAAIVAASLLLLAKLAETLLAAGPRAPGEGEGGA